QMLASNPGHTKSPNRFINVSRTMKSAKARVVISEQGNARSLSERKTIRCDGLGVACLILCFPRAPFLLKGDTRVSRTLRPDRAAFRHYAESTVSVLQREAPGGLQSSPLRDPRAQGLCPVDRRG